VAGGIRESRDPGMGVEGWLLNNRREWIASGVFELLDFTERVH
jgi:hypothetical protein